eukprot:6461184-Alexandrium_andersonii.AAC.1
MIAPRVEDPRGSLQRTITIQEHTQKITEEKWIGENNRSLWNDGVPRIGRFNKRSYPGEDVIDQQ